MDAVCLQQQDWHSCLYANACKLWGQLRQARAMVMHELGSTTGDYTL